MSIYEIIAVVFSSISLLTSVPAFILSVRQNKKLNFSIVFKLEQGTKIYFQQKKDGSFFAAARASIINVTDQPCTIKRITAVNNDEETELYLEFWNGSSVFWDVALQGNQIISRLFAFSMKSLPKRKVLIKIYTNRKVFKTKIDCLLKTQDQ